MRILHLLASPLWSGPAENIALLAMAQRALGHDVKVAVDRKRSAVLFEEPSAPRFREMGLLDEGGLDLSVKSMPWAMAADALALRRRPVEVVHAHFGHDHFIARWGRPRGALVVRSLHALRSVRRTLPAADAWTVPVASAAGRFAEPTLVLGPAVGDAFRPAGDVAALQGSLGLTGTPVVGMVSTFQPSRRHDVGVAAFARLRQRLPEAQWVLLGDGPLLPAIRAQVERERIPGVVFAGYRPGDEFVRWLQSLDAVWILGLGNDFSARAAAQARACGVRVIAVAEGALPDLADAIVDPLTPEAVEAATLSSARRDIAVVPNAELARQVIDLYVRAGANG